VLELLSSASQLRRFSREYGIGEPFPKTQLDIHYRVPKCDVKSGLLQTFTFEDVIFHEALKTKAHN
jgi:hypothetical protein